MRRRFAPQSAAVGAGAGRRVVTLAAAALRLSLGAARTGADLPTGRAAALPRVRVVLGHASLS